jgi:hypothetical protein
LQTLLDQPCVDVEKEVVHILHGEPEVVEPQFIWQRRGAVELCLVDKPALDGHLYFPHESFNDTARLNTGLAAE